MQKQNIAVVLSGCGALDGSEIHEATLTLLALDRKGINYQCLAPNIPQARVTNMFTKETETSNRRNVLVESARIARGKIKPIEKANPDDYAAVIFPGGFGAALNLCNFGLDKENYTIQPEVLKFSQALITSNKPAGFICIAPVLAVKLYAPNRKIEITIGNDKEIAAILEKNGAQHSECAATACVVDKKNKVVSTPAYMLAKSINEVATGIECLVNELIALIP